MADNNFINSSEAFLGRGWQFPVTFTRTTNGINLIEGEADIKNSLQILMGTALGERVMQPGYGSNLDKLIFEPLDTTFATFLTDQLRTAILFNEPRVVLENIDYIVDNNGGRIDISIDYTVVATNSRNNLVYPFYLTEATDI
jgi:uncharacterized protein